MAILIIAVDSGEIPWRMLKLVVEALVQKNILVYSPKILIITMKENDDLQRRNLIGLAIKVSFAGSELSRHEYSVM